MALTRLVNKKRCVPREESDKRGDDRFDERLLAALVLINSVLAIFALVARCLRQSAL